MNIRRTYWVTSFSLFLSFSLVLPFCCHAEMTESTAHHREMSSHDTHGQSQDTQQCNCGHEYAKDYQKTKKVAHSQDQLFSSAVEFPGRAMFPFHTHPPLISFAIPPGLLDDSSPPLHLMISVFLN